MPTVTIKETIPQDIQRVWELVTSLTHYAWRSNIARIDVLEEGKTFVEHTRDGYSTQFTITQFIPCEMYQFQLKNQNMEGIWTGRFIKVQGGTEIEFTEQVTIKRRLLRPFAKAYLKRQQREYVADLKKAALEKRI